MADNRDAPMGFTPVSMMDGSEIPVRRYPLLATHVLVGVGDVVEVNNAGTIDVDDDPTSNPQQILGVVVALYDSDGNPISSGNSSIATKYIPASVAGYADVALAVANAIFQAQTDGTVAEIDRFSSADTAYTGLSTVTGRSKSEISNTAQTGAANWLIIDKVDDPGNAWGEFVNLLVVPCESFFVPARAGV